MKHLSKNLKYLREKNKLSQEKMANLISVKRGMVSHYESGKSLPPLNILNEIANYFSIKIDDLLNEDLVYFLNFQESENVTGKTPKISPNSNHLPSSSVHLTKYTRNKSLFVPSRSSSAYNSEWTEQYLAEEGIYLDIPGIVGESRTFELSGTSMVPVLLDGDYLVCTRVQDTQHIKNNGIYALYNSRSELYIKYAQHTSEGLRLVSANQMEYAPTLLPYDEVTEVWAAVMRITRSIEHPSRLMGLPTTSSRIRHMEEFLTRVFPDFRPLS